MRRLALVAMVLLFLLPPVQADVNLLEARIDVFHDIRFSASDFSTDCPDESRLEVLDRGAGFRFSERDSASANNVPGAQPGYMSNGCGDVTIRLPLPADASRITVRFAAHRTVQSFGQDAGADLHQQMQILDAAGRIAREHHVFPPNATSGQKQEAFATDALGLGPSFSVRWTFRDDGFPTAGISNPFSGQAFSAEVHDVVVQVSRTLPLSQVETSSRDSRDGTLVTTEHHIRVQVGAFGSDTAPAVSVRLARDGDFFGVRTPEGLLLRDVATHDSSEVLGYAQTQSTLSITEAYTEVTFPRVLVDAHGPGEYTFIFRDTDGLHVSPVLVPLAAVLLIAPLPFAVLAWIESRAFRREAFGRYAASARNLQWGVTMVFLYYGAVVLTAAAGGRIMLMAVWPPPLEGWLLYAQVVLAGIAFTVLWLVARELFLIVRPPRPEMAPAPAAYED